MGQRLALPQHPRQPPCSLRTNSVEAQIEMRQRPAPSQNSSKLPHPSIANLVASQIQMAQCADLPQYQRKPPRSLRTQPVTA
eukprot:3941896-Rhodomonas_salina.6